MSFLIILAKIFASLVIFGGMLGAAFYIYTAFKAPTHGTAVQTISGLLLACLCFYAMYWVWTY